MTSEQPDTGAPEGGARAAGKEQFGTRELVQAGVIALIASLVAVTLIRAVALNIFDIPEGFEPLHEPSWVTFTVIGVIAATGACFLLNRFAEHPIRTFRLLALVVLGLSFLPDFAAWAGDEWPGTNGQSIGTLIVLHIAVGAICYYVLPAFGRRRAP
jgi:hypothetical protein